MRHVTLPIFIAATLPFLLTAIAKTGAFTPKDNHQTRVWQSQLSGWRARAHWAHQNAFEAFPAFAAALILSYLAAPQSTLRPLVAWGFIAARVAHAACYLADLAALRSLVWFAGIACVVTLFITAL